MSSNSQNVNFKNIKARDINVNQSMGSGAEIPEPTSKAEFVSAINKLVAELQKISGEHPDIEDAIIELRAVIQETKKARPEPSVIKRLLNTAKGALIDVAEAVSAVGTITTSITMLIGTIKVIFGI